MDLDQLHTALHERAQVILRGWYENPEGKYAGSMVARLGSTTWRFDTGSGWGEPQLVWYTDSCVRSPYRMTWYGDVHMHVGNEAVDPERFTRGVEQLAQRLLRLDWHDPRPPRDTLARS